MKSFLFLILCFNYIYATDLFGQVPKDTSQLIVVNATNHSKAQISLYQKENNEWQLVNDKPINAMVGKNGVVNSKLKREGDKKTPKGLYYLGTIYGTQSLSLHYPYRRLNDQDKFIDDPKSNQYNKWISGSTSAKSYEIMRRDDGIYDLGIVINYNMNPVVKGHGSAIFMHIWYGNGIPTIGCVAMDKSDLLQIVYWMNKQARPMILIQ